jgi:lantibiotic modifying enzyme
VGDLAGDEPAVAAIQALRWVAAAAVEGDGGLTWPAIRELGLEQCDDLYCGTAGVLVSLSEARLSGITEFDATARAATGRLRHVAAATVRALESGDAGTLAGQELGLYSGLAGQAVALRLWADVSGDLKAADTARNVVAGIAAAAAGGGRLSEFTDLLLGEAGILLMLLRLGGPEDRPAAAVLADRLLAQADWTDGGPAWLARNDIAYEMPNFSHGAAGVAFALATAGMVLERPDLILVAQAAGERLARLGARPDGTIAVPHSIPLRDPKAPVSFGWCHGPTGTVRLFQLLESVSPGEHWAERADAGRRAVRTSGLPARLYPGFWDNLGQCCGTAGVGEMALDAYQDSGDEAWLDWAGELATDVLARSTADAAGVRWSHTEYRVSPPELPPSTGWMQGAAGIAGWLLRLARVRRDAAARRLAWPDQPDQPDRRSGLRRTFRGSGREAIRSALVRLQERQRPLVELLRDLVDGCVGGPGEHDQLLGAANALHQRHAEPG